MRRIAADEHESDLPFPLRGIDRTSAFSDQPGLTTHLGKNVRAHEPRTARAKGGSRPGLSRFIDQNLGGPIQELAMVSTTDQEEAGLWALPASPPSLPSGYTDDPSSAGAESSWGTGFGDVPGGGGAGAGPGPALGPGGAPGGAGGGPAGGGGLGQSRRAPVSRFRTGGTGYAPTKNMLRQVAPSIDFPDVTANVPPGTPINYPAPGVDDDGDTFALPVITDPGTGNRLEGEYTFSPAAGTALPIGPTTVTLVFVPDDPKFTPVTDTAVVTVPDPPVAFEQKKDALRGQGATAVSVAPDAPVSAGELLVLLVATDPAAGTEVAVEDNRGGGWTHSGSGTYATLGSLRLSLWYKVLTSAELGGASGSIIVTVTPSQAGGVALALAAYSGIQASSPERGWAANSGTSAAPQVTAPAADAGDLIVVAFAVGAGSAVDVSAPSATLTVRTDPLESSGGPRICLADDVNGAGGGASVGATIDSSMAWLCMAVSFYQD